MKTLKNSRFSIILIVTIFTLSFTNCVGIHTNNRSVNAKHVPPGQAKKMSGAKSAKNHAPGHNK